jgi:hypothetical protein
MAEPTYKSDLSSDEKVLMAIVRAAEIFRRNHAAIFRNYGLSFPQYNVLRVLDASKKSQNKMSDVSRIMLVPSANITGLAKRPAWPSDLCRPVLLSRNQTPKMNG